MENSKNKKKDLTENLSAPENKGQKVFS